MYSFFRNVYSQMRIFIFEVYDFFDIISFRMKPDDEELETLYLNESIDR